MTQVRTGESQYRAYGRGVTGVITCDGRLYTALQTRTAVTAYLKSKQLLPFGFACPAILIHGQMPRHGDKSGHAARSRMSASDQLSCRPVTHRDLTVAASCYIIYGHVMAESIPLRQIRLLVISTLSTKQKSVSEFEGMNGWINTVKEQTNELTPKTN